MEAAAQAPVALAGVRAPAARAVACGSRVEWRAVERAEAGEPALVVQEGDQEVEEVDLAVAPV